MIRRVVGLTILLVGTVSTGACGTNAALSDGSQLIVVKMTNMTFEPATITVHVGDTATFRFVNSDTVPHEAVIGDAAYQARHAAMMNSMTTTSTIPAEHGRSRAASLHPGMNDPNAVTVAPGATGTIVYSFGKVTQLQIGCHEPGHYEAGMKAIIDVQA